MLAIPIIEIRNGICSGPRVEDVLGAVSLNDPLGVIRAWGAAGFAVVHLVDHDALNGVGSNDSVLEDIIRDAGLEIHAKAGVQTADEIERLLDVGASRVIVGTRGIAEPEWLASVAGSNAGELILETALRERRLNVRGWARSLPLDIFDVIDALDGLPMAGLLIAAAQSDGPRSVLELGILEDIADACEFPVLATGGVTTLNQLRALEHRGVAATLLGPAAFADALDARWVAREFTDFGE